MQHSFGKGLKVYIVKKDVVEEVSNIWGYMIQKLDLEPLMRFLEHLLKEILTSLSSYAALEKFSEFYQGLLKRLELFQKFGIA